MKRKKMINKPLEKLTAEEQHSLDYKKCLDCGSSLNLELIVIEKIPVFYMCAKCTKEEENE